MKILVVFPYLNAMGGSEKTLASMAKYFDLDIVTNRFEPEKTYAEISKANVIELKQPNKMMFGLKLMSMHFKGYDVYHSHGYFVNNLISIKNKPTYWYCITPKRDIYKLRNYYLKDVKNPARKMAMNLYLDSLGIVDRYVVKNHISFITSISEEVQREVKRIYNLDSPILYPASLNIEEYSCKSFEEFYLYPGRITPLKRVHVAIEAFNNMPDKKLIVAGFIQDKDYFEYLKNIAGKNVEFMTDLDEDKMINLYARCTAVISLPIKEDFSIVAVEALASGKPVILVNEGALTEIPTKETGLLIEPSSEAIMVAVKKITPEIAKEMSNDCRMRAKIFDEHTFIKKLKEVYEITASLENKKFSQVHDISTDLKKRWDNK